ncbi:MAG: class I SAM-dependent methyltransferase [Candidatus Aminicenantes bacterium]|nr:class I SAM-dependent methyltransferase [Candidatus Aminicenantes bacterium]
MARYVGLSVLHPGGFSATDELTGHCKISRTAEVVDIACGKGTTSIRLAKKIGCHVIGIDISEDLIAEAKWLAEKARVNDLVTFQVGDALNLPFPDRRYDAAISQAMLVLVGDQEKAIQEALRVIKPGGSAGWIELSWRQEPTREFIDEISSVICAACMLNVHTYGDWEGLFKRAGAEDLKTIKHSLKFSGPGGMIRNEGIFNSLKVMSKYVRNRRVRTRMKTLGRFFDAHSDIVGYGIYIVKK